MTRLDTKTIIPNYRFNKTKNYFKIVKYKTLINNTLEDSYLTTVLADICTILLTSKSST